MLNSIWIEQCCFKLSMISVIYHNYHGVMHVKIIINSLVTTISIIYHNYHGAMHVKIIISTSLVNAYIFVHINMKMMYEISFIYMISIYLAMLQYLLTSLIYGTRYPSTANLCTTKLNHVHINTFPPLFFGFSVAMLFGKGTHDGHCT